MIFALAATSLPRDQQRLTNKPESYLTRHLLHESYSLNKDESLLISDKGDYLNDVEGGL